MADFHVEDLAYLNKYRDVYVNLGNCCLSGSRHSFCLVKNLPRLLNICADRFQEDVGLGIIRQIDTEDDFG